MRVARTTAIVSAPTNPATIGSRQTAALGFTRSSNSRAVTTIGERTDGAYGASPTWVGSMPRKM